MYTLIRIEMNNAAFDEAPTTWEVARILQSLVNMIIKPDCSDFKPGYNQALRDINGNKVGYCQVKE